MLALEGDQANRERSNEGHSSNSTVHSQEELDSKDLDDYFDIFIVEDATGNLTFPTVTANEIVLASSNVTSLDISRTYTDLLNITRAGLLENLRLRDIALQDEDNYISVVLRGDINRYVEVQGGRGVNLL